MSSAMQMLMNAVIDYLSEAVAKAVNLVAPSISFGLYACAEALFLYGLYMAFLGPRHGAP
jgi:hypothetical protein